MRADSEEPRRTEPTVCPLGVVAESTEVPRWGGEGPTQRSGYALCVWRSGQCTCATVKRQVVVVSETGPLCVFESTRSTSYFCSAVVPPIQQASQNDRAAGPRENGDHGYGDWEGKEAAIGERGTAQQGREPQRERGTDEARMGGEERGGPRRGRAHATTLVRRGGDSAGVIVERGAQSEKKKRPGRWAIRQFSLGPSGPSPDKAQYLPNR